jgi:DSF synthase
LLRELNTLRERLQQRSGDAVWRAVWPEVDFLVGASAIPGVFSFGGDLVLFRECIAQRNAEALREYAIRCIDLLYANAIDLGEPLTTISLVQGDAIGGGMEMALSSTVVIAERGAKFGLPEILFGLFPGMGAYQLLSQRIGVTAAERFITHGRMRSAAELHEMGLVDIVVGDGMGEKAVADYIRRAQGAPAAHRALHRIRRMSAPVRYQDLIQVADLWVECAMQLNERQMRTMERIAASQNQLMQRRRNADDVPGIDARQEARSSDAERVAMPAA